VSGLRAISQEAASFAAKRRQEGAGAEAISRELVQKFGIACSERTVRRTLARMGVEAPKRSRRAPDPYAGGLRDALTPALSGPRKAQPRSEVSTPPRRAPQAAYDERGALLAMIETLQADLEIGIPPVDRAAIARTIAGLGKRVAEIDRAAEVARVHAAENPDTAWVKKRLARFAAESARHRREALARVPEAIRAEVTRVVEAIVGPKDEDEIAADTADADEEELHAAAV
jgi:hypothetical protein